MTPTEYAQKQTDHWRGVADERESLRRFAPLPPELPPLTPQPPRFAKLTDFSDLLAKWEREDAKKRQHEEEETRSFNLKYGYQT